MPDRPSPPWVVVIAGSSGSLQALFALVSQLPADLPAPVLIVSHTPATSGRRLPVLLSAVGPLPASYPDEGQALEAGRIFIAPPDRHLIIRAGRMRLTTGEKEHCLRPAADVLFRSAARTFGSRSIGIVLSGSGRDGAEGLSEIRSLGGLTLVQEPDDAKLAAMPLNALSVVRPHACVPAAQLSTAVTRLMRRRDAAAHGQAPTRAPPGGQHPLFRSLKGLRVFIAEDEYLIASEIVGMLRELGCGAVGPVANVEAGLRVLAREHGRMDCAVLDVDLRGEQVLPLASVLARWTVPFVFATGYGETTFPEGWADAPRLRKPYDTRALGEALRYALRLRWSPPETPTSPLRVDYKAEVLKDSRNLLMRSGVLQTSSTGKILMRSYETLRKAHECIDTSELRKEAARRSLRAWPPSGSGKTDDPGGNDA